MYTYNILQWLAFFFIYCFIGWCIESTIVSIERKKIVNRGFLKLPLLPIYGSGAIIILIVCLPVRDSIFKVYFVGMICATILEYIVGYFMEVIFKMKYWDYSNDKFNYKGRICLVSSLFWGVLSVLLVEFIHTYIEGIVLLIHENNLEILVSCIFAMTCIDTFISAKESIDLNKVLKKISSLKNEIENTTSEIEEVLKGGYKDISYMTAKELIGSTKEKVENLKMRLVKATEKRKEEITKLSLVKTRLIKNNPTVYSIQFNDALKEIKDRLLNKYGEKKSDIMERIGILQKKIEEFIKEL